MGTGRSQTQGQPRVTVCCKQAWRAPPPPASLQEPALPPTLTNHEGRGLEIGVEGATAFAIFQEDVPCLIPGQREAVHVLQGTDGRAQGQPGDEATRQQSSGGAGEAHAAGPGEAVTRPCHGVRTGGNARVYEVGCWESVRVRARDRRRGRAQAGRRWGVGGGALTM